MTTNEFVVARYTDVMSPKTPSSLGPSVPLRGDALQSSISLGCRGRGHSLFLQIQALAGFIPR